MEAMLTVPVEGAGGLVQQLLRPGYSLHGERLLRPAQVGVGASTGTPDPSAADDQDAAAEGKSGGGS